jgi:hypothetical protein
MKCTPLPRSWLGQKKRLIPTAVVLIVLALSACGGSSGGSASSGQAEAVQLLTADGFVNSGLSVSNVDTSADTTGYAVSQENASGDMKLVTVFDNTTEAKSAYDTETGLISTNGWDVNASLNDNGRAVVFEGSRTVINDIIATEDW